MTYKELLKYCKESPGCIQTKDQKLSDSKMRYQIWLDKANENYLSEKKQK